MPRPAARAIARAARVERIDLRAMRREFDRTWNPVMPLVNALRARLPAQAARFVHWGATSKNIIDTATALQIRRPTTWCWRELDALESALARLAARHRDTRDGGAHARPARAARDVRLEVRGLARRADAPARAAASRAGRAC